MLAARSQEDFVTAVRALDRVLISGNYVIPLFHAPAQWVAYWTRLKMPEKESLYGAVPSTWWSGE
jgi:peptide/nickel transport system substrate-binding protein